MCKFGFVLVFNRAKPIYVPLKLHSNSWQMDLSAAGPWEHWYSVSAAFVDKDTLSSPFTSEHWTSKVFSFQTYYK